MEPYLEAFTPTYHTLWKPDIRRNTLLIWKSLCISWCASLPHDTKANPTTTCVRLRINDSKNPVISCGIVFPISKSVKINHHHVLETLETSGSSPLPPIIPPLHWFQVTSSVRSRYPLPCNPADWISKLFSGRLLQPEEIEREREREREREFSWSETETCSLKKAIPERYHQLESGSVSFRLFLGCAAAKDCRTVETCSWHSIIVSMFPEGYLARWCHRSLVRTNCK